MLFLNCGIYIEGFLRILFIFRSAKNETQLYSAELENV